MARQEKSVETGEWQVASCQQNSIAQDNCLNCLRRTEVADLNALKVSGSVEIWLSDPDCRIRMVSFYVAAKKQRPSIHPDLEA